MADIPFEAVQAVCPPEIAAEVRVMAPGRAGFADKMQAVIQAATYVPDGPPLAPACFALFVGNLLEKPSRPTEEDATLLLSAIRTVAPESRTEITSQVRAFLMGPSGRDLPPTSRFAALGNYAIDVRDALDPDLRDAPMSDPNAAGFQYALYASRLGDAPAAARIEASLRTANASAHMLKGHLLAITVYRPAILRDAVMRYSDATRRGVGVDGPGTGPSPEEILTPWQDPALWR